MDNTRPTLIDDSADQSTTSPLTIEAADFSVPEGRKIVSFVGRFGARKRVAVVGDVTEHLADLSKTLIDDLHTQGNAVLSSFGQQIRIPDGGRAELIDIGISVNRDHNNSEGGGDIIVGVANGAVVITTEGTGGGGGLDAAIRAAIGSGGTPNPAEENEPGPRANGVGAYL